MLRLTQSITLTNTKGSWKPTWERNIDVDQAILHNALHNVVEPQLPLQDHRASHSKKLTLLGCKLRCSPQVSWLMGHACDVNSPGRACKQAGAVRGQALNPEPNPKPTRVRETSCSWRTNSFCRARLSAISALKRCSKYGSCTQPSSSNLSANDQDAPMFVSKFSSSAGASMPCTIALHPPRPGSTTAPGMRADQVHQLSAVPDEKGS